MSPPCHYLQATGEMPAMPSVLGLASRRAQVRAAAASSWTPLGSIPPTHPQIDGRRRRPPVTFRVPQEAWGDGRPVQAPNSLATCWVWEAPRPLGGFSYSSPGGEGENEVSSVPGAPSYLGSLLGS